MKQHLNTLFVTTEGAYLAKEGQAVAVRVEKEVRLRVPLHNIGGIVCLGRIGASPALMGACGEAGVAISFMSEHGRFLARVSGFTSGNVLLRREQYRRADDRDGSIAIAGACIAAKIANCRAVLLRAIRDGAVSDSWGTTRSDANPRSVSVDGNDLADTNCSTDTVEHPLVIASRALAARLNNARRCTDVDQLRGIEGEAASIYFARFDDLISMNRDVFTFRCRSRRPPLDPMNALLSFLYSMLTHDARSACESAGLDPAVGFLHRDRPGRPSLALDLIEELRPFLADRLVFSLINRRQVQSDDFVTSESGAVRMTDKARKNVITAYQKRKQAEITHPFLNERVSIGLIIHLQARLLARHLRGDLDAYPAFIWK